MVVGLDGYLLHRLGPILEGGGCEVASVPDARRALGLAQSWPPDIVILRSPESDEGRQRIPTLRHGLGVPLIAIGPWPEDGDGCVQALESGADDCFDERRGPSEVLARIRAILRRWPAPSQGYAVGAAAPLPVELASFPAEGETMSGPADPGLPAAGTGPAVRPTSTVPAALARLRHRVGVLLAQGGAPLTAGLAYFRPKADDG
ncbi:MAG: response regulator transcription factor [Chloroflexota bacterium]